jgi:hypothetical protein
LNEGSAINVISMGNVSGMLINVVVDVIDEEDGQLSDGDEDSEESSK